MGNEVKLTPEEVKIVKFIGKKRQEVDDENKLTDTRVDGNKSSVDIHINGFGAEMAFCKLMGIYPLFDTKLPDRIGDAVIDGHTIDVKSKSAEYGKYLSRLVEEFGE